jgi:hypothetical protein
MAKAPTVAEYMAALKHPLKAEVQALREIIQGVNSQITEQIKWNAPSFSYKGYLATMNLHEQNVVRLVFHNGAILDQSSGILEGDYVDRRLVYFKDMVEVKAKKPALVKAIKEWIKLMDAGVSPDYIKP